MRRGTLVAVAAIMVSLLCAVALSQPACTRDRTAEQPGPTTTAGGTAAVATTAGGPTTTVDTSVEITIAAVGDVMVHKPTLRAASYAGPGDSYDFKPTFASVAPYLRMADYTVVNLETRLAGPEFGYTSYPRYNSPGEVADALADAGVDLCATANNHTLDKDWAGVVNTLDRLDEAGLAHVGTYRSTAERQADTPYIVDIKGIKVAFVNYTDYLNGFSPPNDYGINLLTAPSQVATEAKAAREAGADVVIALLHWGKEYIARPNGKQIAYAEGSDSYPGLLNQGVDVILGAHPHVLERAVGVRRESDTGSTNGYVVYSMGNFSSNMVDHPGADYGVIIYVHIAKTGQEVEVTGLSYMGVYMQQYGSYPRKVVIEPLLPGVAPAPDAGLSAREQKRLDSVWQYLTDMYYNPDMNIVPLTSAEIASAR